MRNNPKTFIHNCESGQVGREAPCNLPGSAFVDLIHVTMSVTTNEAKGALSVLLNNPTPDQAGQSVKILNKYFDKVNQLTELVHRMSETLKDVNP